MQKRISLILFFCFLMVSCGTQSTPESDFVIIPSNCVVKPDSKIAFTLQVSGRIEKIEWTTTDGVIEKQGEGEIAIYHSPKEPGNQQIMATVYYEGGYRITRQIICEVINIPDASAVPSQIIIESTITPLGSSATAPLLVKVKAAGLNLYAGPHTNHPIISNLYYEGVTLVVLAKNKYDNWFFVKAPDNKMGWVYMNWVYLDTIEIASIPTASLIPTSPPDATSTPTMRPRKPLRTPGTPTEVSPTTVVP